MRKVDINGYWTYENTPITREGVFPYRGRQIDSDGSLGLDPNQKYMVYRPAKEILKPETLASLNGLFLTDEHEMLGEGQRDPGTKPIAGTVFNVHQSPYEKGVVVGTLKVMSQQVMELIKNGKRQLSCGYYCDYVPQKGEWKGQPYQFIQVNVLGNHIALVKKGRMGDKCQVMDQADIEKQFALYGRKESQVRGKGRNLTCDSAIDINQEEVKFMPNENNYDEMLAKALEGKGVKDKANIDKIVAFINTLPAGGEAAPADPNAAPANDAGDPNAAPAAPADVPPADPAPAPAAQPEPPATQDGDPTAQPPADPAPAQSQPMTVTPEEFRAAVDQAVNEKYAKEDEGRQLAEDIAPKCGNLWKRGMDADDVAAAACEQMGYKDLPKDARIPFVKAQAAEAKKAAGDRACGMDSACDVVPRKSAHSSLMQRYLSGK